MSNQSYTLGTYSPEDVTVVLSQGSFSWALSGYTDGTFVNITREIPASSLTVGGSYHNARVIRGNTASTVTLSLLQTSEDNDILSWLLAKDVEVRDDRGLFEMTIKDNTGRSLYYSDQAFIGNEPDRTFSTTADSRDWTIQCVNLQSFTGGNVKFDPAGVDAVTQLDGTIDDRWLPNT